MRNQQNYIPSSANASFDILKLPNCIYLMENGRCRELSFKKCIGSECRFCVVRDGFDKSKIKWSQRLNSLDEKKQAEISRKYYGGKMPWKSLE